MIYYTHMYRRYVYSIITLLLFIMHVNIVYANSFTGVSLIKEPKYPHPNEKVTLTVQSFSQNIHSARIGWYLNDVLLQEGIGLTQKTITAPQAGSSINISITLNGKKYAHTTITPNIIDLMWEAHTSIPPHYRGRALPTESSKVTIWALPHIGNNTDKASLVFNWYENNRFLQNESGQNKDTITIDAPSLYAHKTISVVISNTAGVTIGKAEVRITNTEPELILYPHTPLLGTLFYSAAQNNTSLPQGKEYTLIAQPYYFSISHPTDLTYTWHFSRVKVLQNIQNTITITQFGISPRISVEATHPHILMQTAQTTYIPKHTPSNSNISDENTRPSLFEQTAP